MFKFYSILIGENPHYTSTFQPASKRKIALYANCLLVPVILWFISGYLLVKNLLEGSLASSLITAFILSFIIFLIERSIIMSNGSKFIAAFRITLGLFVAFFGTIILDEIIFKHDIDTQIPKYVQLAKDAAIKNIEESSISEISKHQILVNSKHDLWYQANKDVTKEADGTEGSHHPNVGPITELKKNVAEKLEEDYQTENIKLATLKTNVNNQKEKAIAEIDNNYNGNALLIRERAMFDLLLTNKIMLIDYIPITVILFLLEFLVVIIKMCSKKSIDEELEIAREELLRSKTQKILERSTLFCSPDQLVPMVKTANNLVKQNVSSIFN